MFNFFKEKKIDYDFCIKLKEKDYPKYLMKIYKQKMGYKFNLKKPKTINEIIQYLKIYDNTEQKALLSDKTKSNDYFIEKIQNKKFVKEVYGIYDSILDVNYEDLPNRFIIKKNNSSKVNIGVPNKEVYLKKYKYDVERYFMLSDKINYAFFSGFELQYKNIPNKILIERLYPKVQEYQILCSNGNALFVTFVDKKENALNKIYHLNDNQELLNNIPQKEKINEMIKMAKILSENIKLVRVDFMLINKEYTFFQEFTFTPYSGFAYFIPEYNSTELGKKILL